MKEFWTSLVSLGFKLLYNELAWTYDLVSWLASRGQWRAWQQTAIPFLSGELVLELAHGPGHMLLALESAGFQVVGLDLSPFMGKQARKKIKNLRDRIALVRGSGQMLPFKQETFDSVLSTFPTEFLAKVETIISVHRVLKPGGCLVIVPQARFTGTGPVTRFLEWLYAITGQRPKTQEVERGPFWQQVRTRFENAGFGIEIKVVAVKSSDVTVVIARKQQEALAVPKK
jgi:ubiquinone/menaquinone biosynthesis C-methylase UbiE